MEQPTATEIAILKTLLYGDVFDFPMTAPEIHHFLIGQATGLETVKNTLESSDWLASRITRLNGYYATRRETAELRHYREEISAELCQQAERYGAWLAYLPYVKMVALTGALAMRNATGKHEDFDYLIVAAPGRVWMTRLLAVIMVRVARLWGVELCPNYVMSSATLEQHRCDLYTAHEVVQMVPISGYDLYQQIRRVNNWSDAMLPNAQGCFYASSDHRPRGIGRGLRSVLEWALSGKMGDWLENWERNRRQAKFVAAARESEYSAAEIDNDRVKGHFIDYGHVVLERFSTRLAAYELKHEE